MSVGVVKNELLNILYTILYTAKEDISKKHIPQSKADLLGLEIGRYDSLYYETIGDELELDIYSSGSKSGYSGGTAYIKVIRGTTEIIKEWEDEDQYTYTKWRTVKIKPVDGVVITEKYSSWNGYSTYTIYLTKEKEKELEEELKRRTRVNILKSYIDKNINRQHLNTIIENIKYIKDEGEYDETGYDGVEIIKYTFLDKNMQEIACLYIEDTYTQGSVDTDARCRMQGVSEYWLTYKKRSDWVTIGYSNQNVLDTEIKVSYDISAFNSYKYFIHELFTYSFVYDKDKGLYIKGPKRHNRNFKRTRKKKTQS